MHILVVVPEIFEKLKGGGERYAVESARALRERGVQTEVLVVTALWHFQVIESNGTLRNISLGEANRYVKSCDLVHVHALNSHAFDYSALATFFYQKPLILTDHGGGWRNPGRIFGKHRLRLVNAGAFVSQWSASDLDPLHVIQVHKILYGGGDHLPLTDPFSERYDFGFVGRILPHKGLHVIVEALPRGASLVVAGQVLAPFYMREVRQLALGKKVTFLQDAEDPVVASLYRSVRYLLVPSVTRYRRLHFRRPELLGLVALEAMFVGTPVIGSDIAGLSEVLRRAGQRTLPPGDVEAWRAGLRQALTLSLPRVSETEFTWDAVAERCLALYDVIVTTGQRCAFT